MSRPSSSKGHEHISALSPAHLPMPTLKISPCENRHVHSPSMSAASTSTLKVRKKSSGRGGSGNMIMPSSLLTRLEYDPTITDLLQRRKQAKDASEPSVSNMGRGGTGNIGTATSQKNVPFDVSKDPDDNHEDIVREKAAKERKNTPSATGRGGRGNIERKKPKPIAATDEGGKTRWIWSGTSASSGSPRSPGFLSPSSPTPSPASRCSSSLYASQLSLSAPSLTPESMVHPSQSSNSNGSTWSVATPSDHEFSTLELEEQSLQTRKHKWWKIHRRFPSGTKHQVDHPRVPQIVIDISPELTDETETRTTRESHTEVYGATAYTSHSCYDFRQSQSYDDDYEEDYYSDGDSYYSDISIEASRGDNFSAYALDIEVSSGKFLPSR